MHNNLTAGQLALALNTLVARLDRFGYTTVSSPIIEMTTDKDGQAYMQARLYFRDDFQSKLEYDQYVQLGHIYFSLSDDGSHFVIPANFLAREQRELEVLAGQIGRSREMMKEMQSAAAKAFVETMTAELDKYKLLR